MCGSDGDVWQLLLLQGTSEQGWWILSFVQWLSREAHLQFCIVPVQVYTTAGVCMKHYGCFLLERNECNSCLGFYRLISTCAPLTHVEGHFASHEVYSCQL
jgi:hypothetical protein